jgi:hypothetical protein
MEVNPISVHKTGGSVSSCKSSSQNNPLHWVRVWHLRKGGRGVVEFRLKNWGDGIIQLVWTTLFQRLGLRTQNTNNNASYEYCSPDPNVVASCAVAGCSLRSFFGVNLLVSKGAFIKEVQKKGVQLRPFEFVGFGYAELSEQQSTNRFQGSTRRDTTLH